MNNFVNYNFDINKILIACFVTPSGTTKVHKDRPSHGLIFHTSGHTTYTFQNNKALNVPKNNLLYLPKHSSYTVDIENDSSCYAINFDFFNETIFEPFALYVKNTSSILELFKKTEQCWRNKSDAYEVKCKANLYNILYSLCIEYKNQYIPQDKVNIIKPAIDYIHSQYTNDNINISHLADICGISESYFRSIFLKTFSISPVKYINTLKLTRAKELLKTGLYSVSDAAFLSGFHDESYFTREFKKFYGVCPSSLKCDF